jgi:hypothetical protein
MDVRSTRGTDTPEIIDKPASGNKNHETSILKYDYSWKLLFDLHRILYDLHIPKLPLKCLNQKPIPNFPHTKETPYSAFLLALVLNFINKYTNA